jgi:hypothetical protein
MVKRLEKSGFVDLRTEKDENGAPRALAGRLGQSPNQG